MLRIDALGCLPFGVPKDRPEISSDSNPLIIYTPFGKAKINREGVKNKNFFFVGGSIISERGGGQGGGGVVSEVCRPRLKSETPPV